jgi:hypothetical protein
VTTRARRTRSRGSSAPEASTRWTPVRSRAQQLEGLGFLGITMQFVLNTQFRTGWKLLMPK